MIILRTHPAASVTRIPDLGVVVDGGAGFIELEDLDELREASASPDLLELLLDEAFGVGASTLVLVSESGTAVPLEEVEACLKAIADLEEDPVRVGDLLITTTGQLVYDGRGRLLTKGGAR